MLLIAHPNDGECVTLTAEPCQHEGADAAFCYEDVLKKRAVARLNVSGQSSSERLRTEFEVDFLMAKKWSPGSNLCWFAVWGSGGWYQLIFRISLRKSLQATDSRRAIVFITHPLPPHHGQQHQPQR